MKKGEEEQRRLMPGESSLEWSTLALGAQEMSVKRTGGTVASRDIFRVIAEISVTTRETKADRAKGRKLGPTSLSTVSISKRCHST